jgi:energy-coupling factor transporter ATP-binding protein EcfA2
MTTILIGSNFSGRSKWLSERRTQTPWPGSALLGPTGDLAFTGLTSTVREELAVAAMGQRRLRSGGPDIFSQLALSELLDHKIHALSGGEAIRVALASLAVQGVAELQIDTALEQLDEQWRRTIFTLLREDQNRISKDVFVADNHLSTEEASYFNASVEFPVKGDHRSEVPKLDPTRAIRHIGGVEALPVEIEEVSFAYSRRSPQVLKNVSLMLEPGRPYFLIGPNGSGKTTLVKMLSGTVLPQRGNILVAQRPFRPGRSRKRFASLSFQNPDFQWTSQSVVGEFKNTDAALRAILPDFGVPAEFSTANPNELPFVLKKRISTALSVLAGKSWYILDEPTIGQDHDYRLALAELIRRALNRGAGVLMVSHDIFFRSQFHGTRELRFHDRTVT